MFEFVVGVVVGAVFAPFWMKAWDKAKEFVKSKSE